MSDLIDRQTALDAIDAWRREYPLDLQEPIDDCWNSIRELPAVQPDHNADISKKASISCGHENDLISRQAALDVVGDWIYNPEDLRYHKDVINSIPAVQPEIIRCRDCRFNDGTAYCVFHFRFVKGEDFCSWAERRTDEQSKSD